MIASVVKRAVCAAIGLAVIAAPAAEPATPDGVLILHSNQRPTAGQVIIDDTLRAAVPQEFKRPVQLFSEYLDEELTSLQTYGLVQAEFLRERPCESHLLPFHDGSCPSVDLWDERSRTSLEASAPLQCIPDTDLLPLCNDVGN